MAMWRWKAKCVCLLYLLMKRRRLKALQNYYRLVGNNNNNNVFDLYSALSTNVIKGAGVTSKAGISQQQMQGKINEFLSRNKIC